MRLREYWGVEEGCVYIYCCCPEVWFRCHKVEAVEAGLKGAQDYLFRKGNLHDCKIRRVAWSLELSRLEISIFDLNANFMGLPEYCGPQPGCLIFEGVQSVRLDARLLDGKLRIYEVLSRIEDGMPVIEFQFFPSGMLQVHFGSMSFDEYGADSAFVEG